MSSSIPIDDEDTVHTSIPSSSEDSDDKSQTEESNRPSQNENRYDGIGNEVAVSLEMMNDADDAPQPMPFSSVVAIDEEEDDDLVKKKAFKSSNASNSNENKPEHVSVEKAPLPHPGVCFESTEDVNVLMKKIKASQHSSGSVATLAPSTGQIECVDAEAPMPVQFNDPPDDTVKKTTNLSNGQNVSMQNTSQVEIDVEDQRPVRPFVQVSQSEDIVVRRKILYENENASTENKTGPPPNNTVPHTRSNRLSILHYIPRLHPSLTMEDVPIPDTRDRHKMKNIVAALLMIVMILLIVIISLVVSSDNKKSTKTSNSDGAVTNTTLVAKVPSPTPPDSSPQINLEDYNLRICNPVDGQIELCTVGNCFSGPQCSCEMFFRESDSKSMIGFCDSCRICDFDGNMAYDCGNLDSSMQECPASSTADDGEDDEALDSLALSREKPDEYSPPDNYDERFCITAFIPGTELCFAGECTDDVNCQCDLYTRDVATKDILRVCDSCGVCKNGSFSSNCVNVGLTAVACIEDETDVEFGSSDQTIQEADDVDQTMEEDASNQTLEDANNNTSPQLSQTDKGADSSSVQESVDEPSGNTDGYICADPNNGIQFCQSQSCKDPGCKCDAYFREVTMQQTVGTCSNCVVCDNGAVGMVCDVYGVEMDLSC